jgi:hypothetical protein
LVDRESDYASRLHAFLSVSGNVVRRDGADPGPCISDSFFHRAEETERPLSQPGVDPANNLYQMTNHSQ